MSLNLLRVLPRARLVPVLARGKATVAKSSAAAAAIIHEKTLLPDGSVFLSRVPSSPSDPSHLPPPIRPITEKLYHLTDAQKEEIRQLRAQDPKQWSRRALAAKFGCTPFAISIIAPASPEHRADVDKALEHTRLKHGYKRRQILQNRILRKAQW